MKSLYLFLACLVTSVAIGQTIQDQAARIAEDLVAIQDEDVDYETIYENILQQLSNPVDLNLVTGEELRQLHVLSEVQIREIMDHRSATGAFISIYELQALESVNATDLELLKQLFFVRDPASALDRSFVKRIKEQGNHYLVSKVEKILQDKAGFTTSADSTYRFAGSPLKFYTRFRSSRTKDYSFGVTMEKDPGESIQWRPKNQQFGFDFISFHAQIQNKAKLKNLLIGDFQAQFGQGLIFGGGFGLGKGSETVSTIRRSNVGILPYTSLNEAGFFRGGALTYKLSKALSVTLLFSRLKRDANQDLVAGTITSFQLSGLHRNADEMSSRKIVTEQNEGLIVEYSVNQFTAGVIIHQINFSQPVVKRPTPYNQFAFTGDELTTSGFFANYQFHNANIFGEFAKNENGGNGAIIGTLISLSRTIDAGWIVRRYAKDYNSFYSNALAESSQPQNERAVYWGLKYQPNRRYAFAGYVDLFEFPWLGFRRYSPSYGYEYLLKTSYQPDRKTVLSLQFRQEKKERNALDQNLIYSVSQGVKNNLWLKMNYTASSTLSMKSQLQWNTYSLKGNITTGFVMIQDAVVTVGRLKITGRYALFDSGSFNNRTYAYENDTFMSFSIPAYDGTGIRDYVMLQYKLTRWLDVWLRYSQTKYSSENEISSGVDNIAGNTRNDVKFQALIKI